MSTGQASVTRARALNALRIGLLVVIVAACVIALWANWQEVSGQLRKLSVPVVVGAFALVTLAPILTLMGWRVLLEDLGTQLPLPPASSVFLVGQLGKYLPGSVWTVVAQAEMGAKLAVPRRRMAVVGILSIGLAVLTGCLLGIPAVQPLVASRGDAFSWWWVVLAVALTSAWFVAAWVSTGMGTFVLARSVAPEAPLGPLLVTCIGGFALASAAGMFSILVPAGVGVRDGVLALLLVTLMPLPAATAVVVVARFLAVLADLLLAGSAWAWGRRHHLLGSTT